MTRDLFVSHPTAFLGFRFIIYQSLETWLQLVPAFPASPYCHDIATWGPNSEIRMIQKGLLEIWTLYLIRQHT